LVLDRNPRFAFRHILTIEINDALIRDVHDVPSRS
jgi:hypothetical protein